MTENKKSNLFILGSIIIVVQIFDILVHVFTNQIEPIRIISNVIIMAWVVTTVFSLLSLNRMSSIGVLLVYLILNTIFLFREGPLNAYGDYRILFFILITTTSILSILLIRKTNES